MNAFRKASVHWILNILEVSAQNTYHSNVVSLGPHGSTNLLTFHKGALLCRPLSIETSYEDTIPKLRSCQKEVMQHAEERPWESGQRQGLLCGGQCHRGQSITMFMYKSGLQWWERVRLHNTFWTGTKTCSSDPGKQWQGVRHFPHPLMLCAILSPYSQKTA